jgi:hypothetical protein
MAVDLERGQGPLPDSEIILVELLNLNLDGC